ncbi:hypothetical protein DID88_009067 [Monilinia fructigena]|uniref:General negative regulator of transcription subunit n=1 Tax=Monilinia fructigena TaxID=38457 RepID=A0A395IHX1_9HELO|nr:hypothetical protein DID88_009067 [Monilinia fructigena]
MAARKLQQEVDKCFKKVTEGVAEFESIYDKIEQCTNAAQKEKLEDNLKREIKKLQRLRDQIKTWAASNDIKDKGPLLDHRKLIETVGHLLTLLWGELNGCSKWRSFKAVEKAMKTKAYSKEGLSAAAKLDPKERAKMETGEFLGNMVEELERQIETMEAERESISATMKKGKSQSAKADRIAELDNMTERHKFHQNKLELIKRCLENGNVEVDQVKDLEESIKYYVTDNMNDDFMEDEEIYDELNLDEEEDNYGMNNDNDRVSSQDTQSIQEDIPDSDLRSNSLPGKSKSGSEPPLAVARRPSAQLKSPLPSLATLHTPLSTVSTNASPTAAAAAASDKNGIAPLPPPPEALPAPVTSASHPPLSGNAGRRPSVTASPTTIHSQAASVNQTPVTRSSVPTTDTPSSAQTKSPALSQSSAAPSGASVSHPAEKTENARPNVSQASSGKAPALSKTAEGKKAAPPQSNGVSNGLKPSTPENTESVYHLPSGFQDMLQSFEVIQKSAPEALSTASLRMLASSQASGPSMSDILPPRTYKPEIPYTTPSYYPQDVPSVLDDPRLYSKIDGDTLFYVFYYKQATYQQYLAAKSLKEQSWRFHKQYQTWFQRHEEPKEITELWEQGTYRFFDYESTWMNRRKADFKFTYKFLEDDV